MTKDGREACSFRSIEHAKDAYVYVFNEDGIQTLIPLIIPVKRVKNSLS
tara:strand:+ start:168 stop:314 length:147 start_codon:yes stop_codon:yes gene_type:complete